MNHTHTHKHIYVYIIYRYIDIYTQSHGEPLAVLLGFRMNLSNGGNVLGQPGDRPGCWYSMAILLGFEDGNPWVSIGMWSANLDTCEDCIPINIKFKQCHCDSKKHDNVACSRCWCPTDQRLSNMLPLFPSQGSRKRENNSCLIAINSTNWMAHKQAHKQ